MSGNYSMYTDLAINEHALVFLMVFTSVQMIIGSTANCVVIFTTLRSRGLTGRSEDRLILNLAVADFLALATFLPLHIYVLWQGKMSTTVQRNYEALNTFVVYYGGNSLLAIACDRFVAVLLPLRHWKLMSKRVTLFMTILTFSAAAFFAILDLLSSDMTHPARKLLIKVFFIPYIITFLTTLALLYSFILYSTLKQARQILRQTRGIGVHFRNYSRRLLVKATMKISIVVVLFYATYLPLLIYVLVYSSIVENQERIAQATARSWIYSFLFLNCCANPFVYALQTARFRAAFSKVLLNAIRRPRASRTTAIST